MKCLTGCLTFATIDNGIHLFAYQVYIDPKRCDACGNCYTICPVQAVEIVIEPQKN